MAQSLEFEIKYLFSRNKSPLEIAENLLIKWNAGKLTSEEQFAVILFLLNSNLITKLLEQFSKLLLERQKIPWASFIETLSASGVTIRRDDIDQILLGAAEENALNELVASKALDKVDARFEKIREDLFPSKRSSRFRPSSAVLELKRKLFDFEKRSSSQEAREEQEKLKAHFMDLAKANPEQAYDISVSMHMMGFSETALLALALAQDTEAKTWLQLTLFLESEKYLDALLKCDEIEKSQSDSFKAMTTILYSRALALKGLGQLKDALKTLEQLRGFDPNFYLAHSLLVEWKSELP
jgi:hypothetical protein